jgi:pSer/pThr/pTyr-binding forkhead associated (FHA) protein
VFIFEVISGPYRGQAIKLVQGQVITIGRSPECTVTFADSQLSARHAEFDWSEQGFSVFDLGSSNGTFLNGKRLEGRASMALGDHLQVGQTILQLSDEDLEFSELELIDTEAPKHGQMLAMSSTRTQIAPAKMKVVKGQMLALGDKKTEVQKRSAQLQVDDLSIAAAAKLKDVVAAGGHGSKVVLQRDGRHDPFWSTPVTIGREQASGIVLDDSSVSLRHAVTRCASS